MTRSRRTCRSFGCERIISPGEDRCAGCRGQETLFAEPDPLPSLDTIQLNRQRLLVFEALCEMQRRDPRGANAFELQAWLIARGEDRGIQRNAVSSRLRELATDYGFVAQVDERQAPTGKPEIVFAPTARGLEWRRLQAEAA